MQDEKWKHLLGALETVQREIARRIPPPKAEILIGEASRRLGCSRNWTRTLADTGKLKTRRTADGFVLFDAKSVDQYARGKIRTKKRRPTAAKVSPYIGE